MTRLSLCPQDFLSTLVPPMSVPDHMLSRWHPRFNVDAVPPVEPSPLPQPPQTDKLSTAQEVLDKARSLLTPKVGPGPPGVGGTCPPGDVHPPCGVLQMEKALVSLTLPKDEAQEAREAREPAPSQKPAHPVPRGLKGVSQSLVDRVGPPGCPQRDACPAAPT